MKKLKKVAYLVILPIFVTGGLVFAIRKNEITATIKPLSSAERKSRQAEDRKKWEATPDGLNYIRWEASAEGKKVNASHDKIRKYIKDFSSMKAVVTSVTFQRPNAKSSAPKWLIVKIEDEQFMMQFSAKEFEQLSKLKVNDVITVKSHSAGYSPNHPYLIVSGDYIEQNNKLLFKRDLIENNGC